MPDGGMEASVVGMAVCVVDVLHRFCEISNDGGNSLLWVKRKD